MADQAGTLETRKDDITDKELNTFINTLLEGMQTRFNDMSQTIVGRIDEMTKKIEQLETTMNDLMKEMEITQNDEGQPKQRTSVGCSGKRMIQNKRTERGLALFMFKLERMSLNSAISND
eukprot:TRINITY_DN4275_c0_g1_i6.p1 TRINITY_DN4275_c0_g1~~TRINITY_DN4275_c0_g1_i6.p1  ORF type:complete len:120 (+),score=33.35 TRINITY_DN4275_c0_g1_i6:84-443(+)